MPSAWRNFALNWQLGIYFAGAVHKPNSVSPQSEDGNHSSCPGIAPGIQRSTQKRRTGRPSSLAGMLFYLTLLRVGFTVPPLLPETRCALTAPFHPCPAAAGRYIFCGTFRRVAPPSSYEAHCPVEFGLSSASLKAAIARPTPAQSF